MGENKRFATFDFFRILFACGIVLGHTYINFFQKWFIENHKSWQFERVEQICVSVFFIMSGIFIARSAEKTNGANALDRFTQFQTRKLFRLYEPVLLVTVLYLIARRFIEHSINIKKFALYWPNLLMIGSVNNIPANNILWYAVCLFWCSLPLSALLFVKRDWSVRLVFPLAFFFGFSFLYNKCGHLPHVVPLFGRFFSAGLIRCTIELIIGIELFYAVKAFQKKFTPKDIIKTKFVIAVLEFFSLLGMAFVIIKQRWGLSGYYEFVTYPACAVLFFIFLQQKEVLFRFCSWLKKPISFLAKYTYMLYLTHTLLIQPAKRFVDFTCYNCHATLVATLVVCWVFAIVMYHLNGLLVRGLCRVKDLLVAPAPSENTWGGGTNE